MRKHFYALKKSLKVESCHVSQVQVCLNITFGALQMRLALHRLLFSVCVRCGATELCLWLRKRHVSLLYLLIACVMYSALSSVIATVMFSYTHLWSLGISQAQLQDRDRVRSRLFLMGWHRKGWSVSDPRSGWSTPADAHLRCYNTGTTQRWEWMSDLWMNCGAPKINKQQSTVSNYDSGQ